MQLLLTHQPRDWDSELLDELIGVYYPEGKGFISRPLGVGYFSSVWAIPGEPYKVLKVSHRHTDACRSYMEWAFAHPHPNAPKIHSITHVDHLMLVVMDRYYPLDEPLDTPYEQSFCLRDNVPGYRVLMGLKRPDHRLGHEQLCATIRRQFVRKKFDLHKDNVMVDRYGTIIITDPVSYEVDEDGDILNDI